MDTLCYFLIVLCIQSPCYFLQPTLSFGTGNGQHPVGALATSSQSRYEPPPQQHKVPIKLSTGGIVLSGVRPPALARRNGNKDVNSHVSSCNNPHDSRRKSKPFHNHNHHHRSTSSDNSVDSHYSRRHLDTDSDNFNMGKSSRKPPPTSGRPRPPRDLPANQEASPGGATPRTSLLSVKPDRRSRSRCSPQCKKTSMILKQRSNPLCKKPTLMWKCHLIDVQDAALGMQMPPMMTLVRRTVMRKTKWRRCKPTMISLENPLVCQKRRTFVS